MSISRLCLLIVGGCTAIACGPHIYENPISVMLDRERAPNYRLKAATQAQRQHSDQTVWIDALKKLAWSYGQPLRLREYAVYQLVALDSEDFRCQFAQRLTQVRNLEMLSRLLRLAIDRRWPDITPVIVASLARAMPWVPDAQRPETAALEEIHPDKSITEVAFAVMVNGNVTIAHQAAAWQLLNRSMPRDQLEKDLLGLCPTTSLVANLHDGVKQLHVLPVNKAQVLWLSYLRSGLGPDWDRYRDAVHRLQPENRKELGLRHLRAVSLVDESMLRMNRESLRDHVAARLRTAEVQLVESRWEGSRQQAPQRWEAWEVRLSWADLITLHLIVESLQDQTLRVELFRQAEFDLADRQSEHGGALVINRHRTVARSFEPITRRHDRMYVPPPELITELYGALAHYHFHAQAISNSKFACPGRADLQFADRWGFHCLVFTFIDRDKLNVDFYGPGHMMIDLGTILRPSVKRSYSNSK